MPRDNQLTLQSTVDVSSLAVLGEPNVAIARESVPVTRWKEPTVLVPLMNSVPEAVGAEISERAMARMA
ncbi:MAG: hypothetical protein ACYC91_07080 [Solirubrobacteraceae bacterium]